MIPVRNLSMVTVLLASRVPVVAVAVDVFYDRGCRRRGCSGSRGRCGRLRTTCKGQSQGRQGRYSKKTVTVCLHLVDLSSTCEGTVAGTWPFALFAEQQWNRSEFAGRSSIPNAHKAK
jgi:hypothetical protein